MATVRDWVRLAARAAEDRKAQNLVALDLRGIASMTDYFVVVSGTSDTHVRAIAGSVREKLAEKGQRPFSFEGYPEGTWVLIDYVDFVVHIFHHEQRLYYGIEELWADARKVNFRAAAPRAAAPKKAVKARAAAPKGSVPAKRPRAAKKGS